MPARRDPLTNTDIQVQINGTKQWWILDTGANITTLTLTTAKRLGLTLSRAPGQTQSGATGKEIALWGTVIPELKVGGAIVRNSPATVMEDKALDIDMGKNGPYQIQGILGYPVLATLGSFTFSGDAISVAPETQPTARSAKLYVEELTPLVEAQVHGQNLLFIFDTGNTGAELTAKYAREFPNQFSSLKIEKSVFAGAGGLRTLPIYVLPELVLQFGSATAALKKVRTVATDRGVDPVDSFYGNLGQAVLHQFRSYTIDFTRMQLTFGESAH